MARQSLARNSFGCDAARAFHWFEAHSPVAGNDSLAMPATVATRNIDSIAVAAIANCLPAVAVTAQ